MTDDILQINQRLHVLIVESIVAAAAHQLTLNGSLTGGSFSKEVSFILRERLLSEFELAPKQRGQAA